MELAEGFSDADHLHEIFDSKNIFLHFGNHLLQKLVVCFSEDLVLFAIR